jgi:uncharacterized protein
MKKSPVVHFEMPAKDLKRVAEFYTKAFGWNMKQLGPEMGNYLIAQTTETDGDMMVKTPGTINGGFFIHENKPGYDVPHLVIQVDDINEAMESVKAAGGTVEGAPQEIPTVGTYVSITDTEGVNIGMLQASK